MFDIEMLLYRESKLQGKHIKFFIISNNVNINVIIAKIIGVVNEDNISFYPVLANDNYNDKNEFDIFIPSATQYDNNITSLTDYNEIFEATEKLTETSIENNLYDKLISSYDAEMIDTTSNNYELKKNYEITDNVNTNNYELDLKNINQTIEAAKQDELERLKKNKEYADLQNKIRLQFLADLQKRDEEIKQYKLASFKKV